MCYHHILEAAEDLTLISDHVKWYWRNYFSDPYKEMRLGQGGLPSSFSGKYTSTMDVPQ